jgi:hypothetical protein
MMVFLAPSRAAVGGQANITQRKGLEVGAIAGGDTRPEVYSASRRKPETNCL